MKARTYVLFLVAIASALEGEAYLITRTSTGPAVANVCADHQLLVDATYAALIPVLGPVPSDIETEYGAADAADLDQTARDMDSVNAWVEHLPTGCVKLQYQTWMIEYRNGLREARNELVFHARRESDETNHAKADALMAQLPRPRL